MKNEAKETEKVIEQQNPVMVRKVEALVLKQINILSNNTSVQFEQLLNISSMLKRLQDCSNSPRHMNGNNLKKGFK